MTTATRERARTFTKAAGAPGQPVATEDEAKSIADAIVGDTSRKKMDLGRAAPRLDLKYWAKRTFGYGTDDLDRGQVFRLKNEVNDRRLIELGYVTPLEAGVTTYACGVCGVEFIDMGLRDGHGKARHAPRRFVPPAPPIREPGESQDAYQNRLDEWAIAAGRLSDAADERRDKLEDELAPLDLTRTAASREA